MLRSAHASRHKDSLQGCGRSRTACIIHCGPACNALTRGVTRQSQPLPARFPHDSYRRLRYGNDGAARIAAGSKNGGR